MIAKQREVLGLDRVFALIEAPGEYLAAVKRRRLNQREQKHSELREHLERLGRMMETLGGQTDIRRTLLDLFAHLPNYHLPEKTGREHLALHELFLLKEFLWHYQNLSKYLRRQGLMDQFMLPDHEPLFNLLDPDGSGLPSFRLSPAYSEKLGQILAIRDKLANQLKAARENLLVQARLELELPSLLEEFTVSRANAALAERLLHSSFFTLTQESIANYSFLLADDESCLELKKQLSLLAERQEREEERLLRELTRKVMQQSAELKLAMAFLERSAWLFMLVEFAAIHGCRVPRITRSRRLRIREAVNLPLKLHLEAMGRRFIAIDYDFDHPVSLLTGPNMGGKTTVLKTVGQLCQLARLGIPLPCKEAEVPLFDRIWYNQDDTASSADLSSFGREVVAFSEVLREEGKTLFLLDEFARGTNPAEGELIAAAVLKYLSSSGHMCVAATHFTAPTKVGGVAHFGIAGLDAASPLLDGKGALSPAQRLKALNDAMDYRLTRLRADQSPPLSAIRVARILGLPEAILRETERS